MVNRPLPQMGLCPVATTISLLSSKWKILIVRDLLGGTKRYGELKQSVAGVSQKMLTQSLRELENDGLVIRKVYPEIPPKVEYRLSRLGETLHPVVDALAAWGTMYIEQQKNAENKWGCDISSF